MTAIRLIEMAPPLDDHPGIVAPLSMTSTAPSPVLTQLESALETSCATLVAVEALGEQTVALAAELRRIQLQIGDTIASLRGAIAEFRAAHDSEASVLAYGFVLEPKYSSGAQLKPRRTA